MTMTIRERWQRRFEAAMTAEPVDRVAKLWLLRNDINNLRLAIDNEHGSHAADLDTWFNDVCDAFYAAQEECRR